MRNDNLPGIWRFTKQSRMRSFNTASILKLYGQREKGSVRSMRLLKWSCLYKSEECVITGSIRDGEYYRCLDLLTLAHGISLLYVVVGMDYARYPILRTH